MMECKILLYGKLGDLLKPEDLIRCDKLNSYLIHLPGMRVVEREVLHRAYSDIELFQATEEDVLEGWLVTVDPWGFRNLCRRCGVGVVYRLDVEEVLLGGTEPIEVYIPKLREDLYKGE